MTEKRTYVIKLLEQGVPRLLSGVAGMTFLVDSFTEGKVGRPVAHVRDYRFRGDHFPYQIWSIAADGYEILDDHRLPEPSAKIKTLAEVMPQEFLRGEYENTPAIRLRNVRVIKTYDRGKDTWRPWPGTQKNVFFWVMLENGKAVGWNENPATGWSFPVIAYKE